ncbi:MAG: tetratricopeptide repeat protein [Geobacter sp.]|nr:tetratricopeptide repeat protein [Geobacter sp.]
MDLTGSVTKMFSALNSVQDVRFGVANSLISTGVSLLEKKKYKEAAGALRQATALAPDNVDAYNMLAQAYQKMGKKEDAVKAYVISLKLNDGQSAVHMNLSNLYIDQKKYAEAQKSLKAASKADPADPVPHYTLGLLLQQMEKPKEAEAAFRQTIRLAPRDGNAYYGLATSLRSQGRTDEAIQNLQKAMQFKRGFDAAMVELGRAFADQRNEPKVEEQINALKALGTAQADSFAVELQELLRKPKITGVVTEKSSLNAAMGSTPLVALDPVLFTQPGTMKEFSMTFQFDTSMDGDSVTNIMNWKVGRSSGGAGGLYDNGLYKPTDRASFILPSKVTYNPVNQQATVYFPLYQNEDATGTIDTKRLTFKFMGVDQNGKAMDTGADEYNAWAQKAF